MNILLDTHIILWAIAKSNKLKPEIRELIENKNNNIYYSIVSVWEIAIKHKIHPEIVPFDEEQFVRYCKEVGFVEINIRNNHIYEIKKLENIHKDPFDRLLLAQAKIENISIITSDTNIIQYKYDKTITA